MKRNKWIVNLLSCVLVFGLTIVLSLNASAVDIESAISVSGVILPSELIYSPLSSFGLSIFSNVSVYSVNARSAIYTTGAIL